MAKQSFTQTLTRYAEGVVTPQELGNINRWSNHFTSAASLAEAVGRLLSCPDYRQLLSMTRHESDELLSRFCADQCTPEEIEFVDRWYIELLEIMGVDPRDL